MKNTMRNSKGQFLKGNKPLCPFRKGHKQTAYNKRRSSEINTGQKRHWKGGRILENGYIRIKNRIHPNSDRRGYIREHRLVMSIAIGRAIRKEERIHHINGIKTDNRLSNLICFATESAH